MCCMLDRHRPPCVAFALSASVSTQVNTCRDAKYSLKASYLEIYNEGVRDLVHYSPKAKSLPVKWDAAYGFYVQGLKVRRAQPTAAGPHVHATIARALMGSAGQEATVRRCAHDAAHHTRRSCRARSSGP